MVRKKEYIPDQKELDGAPKKFLYELNMFRKAQNALGNVLVASNDFLRNICLEAALLHARNIMDFFSGNQTHKDDICAGHFIDSSEWWKSKKLKYLDSHREDINKSINHLTYTRVHAKPSWNLLIISEEIEAAYAEFIELLPKNKRSLWKQIEPVAPVDT